MKKKYETSKITVIAVETENTICGSLYGGVNEAGDKLNESSDYTYEL